jgi:hypothetical protein
MGLFGFGGGGEISGYNKGKVEELRGAINTTAQSSAEAIIKELESGVIVPMSTVWYAEEAQQYFEGFKAAVAACGATIHEVFDKFRENVEKTGADWATSTGGEAPTLPVLDEIVLDLPVDAILNINGAGDRMLDEPGVKKVIGSLPTVEQNIKSSLNALAAQLEADTAFLGHGQGAAVQNCLVKVADAVHKIFVFLL